MEHLLQFGLSNAMAAAVLAVLAAMATRVWRNPHFAYALWLVVLLRLVAPPLLPVGVPLPEWMAQLTRDADPPSRGVGYPLGPRGIPVGRVNGPAPMAGTHRLGTEDLSRLETPPQRRDSLPLKRGSDAPTLSEVGVPVRSDDVRNRLGNRESNTVAQAPLPDVRWGEPRGSLGVSTWLSKLTASRRPSIANLLATAWLTGTLCYLLLTAFRVRRFARVLRRARRDVPAGVVTEAAEVAAAVGLRRVPRLAFAEAPLPPMVWPGWRPVVLLPKALFTSLGSGERRLLLWHEFLHLRRRDHLVRWFEVGIVGLYWWNPVAWWAVAQLQQAEEDCCDAAVLVAHPHESARYGETLVSVAHFLSTDTLPAPSLSVGVARNHHIKRRLAMILHGPRWPELSKTRLAALSLLGAALVAVTWTAAKGQTAPASPAPASAPAASVSPASPPQPAGKDDDTSVPHTPTMTIDEILVEGNATIPAATILQKLKTQVGGTATPSQVQEDIRTLIKTHWFFSVVPKYRRTGKKLILVLAVVERPTVRSVDYQGAKEIPLNKLAVEAGLKVGSPFSNGANQDAARHLENFYHQQGYTEATVELIKGDKPDECDVVFRIHEGVKQKVVGRYFVGNKSVSDEKLAMELKSSPAYLIHGDKFDPINTTEDVHVLRKYYAELGFFDATVKPTVHYSKDRKSISLEYAIHEGVRYKIRNFGISGEVPFKMDELLRMSGTHQGQLFDGFQIREELKKLKENYAASGFTPPDVGIQVLFPPGQPGLVDISVRVLHENKKRESLPSAPAQGSNGDTKVAPTSRLPPTVPVSEKRDVGLSQIKEMQPAPGDDELRKLQKERSNAALRELKLNEYQFDIGTTRVSAVCQATRKFVEAWKALAQQPADELRAVDWYVGYTNRLWNGAHTRLMTGGVTGFAPVDEAEARAARFEAQIESMKLRQRLASKTGTQGALETEQAKAATASSAASPSRKQFFTNSYERTDAVAQPAAQSGLFPPNLMPMPIVPTDDEERKLHKQQYNAATEEMRIYRKEWQAGNLDLAAQIENVLAAAVKMRDAELPLCPDAAARLNTLLRYLNLTRSLEEVALGWVKHGGIATVNAPREAVRMHEASLEAELQIARIRRELAQNEQQNQSPSPPPHEKQTPVATESGSGISRQKNDRFFPLYLKHPDQMPVVPTDDAEHKLLKEKYNTAVRAMDEYLLRLRGRMLDLPAQIENIQAAALKLRDAELALCPDAESKVGTLGIYLDFLRNLQKFAHTWVNADGSLGASTPLGEARLREACVEMQLKMAQLLRELAENEQGKTLPSAGPAAGPVVEEPAQPPGLEPRPVYATARRGLLPELLASRPLDVTPHDDARHKSLKEQYNAALRTLQDLHTTPGTDVSVFARSVTTNARQLLEAELALARPNEIPRAYERFIELMKYFDSIQISNPDGSIDVNHHIIAIDEARREAELKLLELKHISVHEDQSKRPAVDATPSAAKTAGSHPAAAPVKLAPPIDKALFERLPLLLTRPPLERQARDDEWHKLLKERFNSAAMLLRMSYRRFALDPAATATKVISAARRVLEADLALTIDPEFSKQERQTALDAWQRYFELMKFLEQKAEARFKTHIGGTDELEEVREARLDAELKLLEAQGTKPAPANFQMPGTWITR
jgi:beta-lactamase regulating signal transducer with metallopeptidase domain